MFPSSNQLQGSSIAVQKQSPLPFDTRPAPNIQVQGPSPQTLLEPTYYPPSAPANEYNGNSGGGGASSGYSTGGSYSGGTSYGYSAPAPPPDPYAQWGGKAAYDSLVSGYNTQRTNIYNTSYDAANTGAAGVHSSILDLLDSTKSGQNKINEAGVQNELAKKQGYQSILDIVSHGLQSGGVLLANKNASDSSAAGAIARAYGDIGRRQNNKVNNQYELGNHNIGLQQEDLNLQKAQGMRHINESEQNSVDSIVASARDKLAALDAAIASSNLPQRIQIEQAKNEIKNSISGILNQYNGELSNGMGAINPASTDTNRASAATLANAGVSAANPFDFSTEAPAQFQGTGPFASDLPLFTTPRKRTA